MAEAEKSPKPSHPHGGHRERMRKRFLQDGLDSFQPHEVLELLLYYALPRVNTNPIAHELLREFHSLSGVLDADVADLMRVKGIRENAAVFLHLLPQLCRLYQLDKLEERQVLDTTEKMMAYVTAQFVGLTEERLLLLSLDEGLGLLSCDRLTEGSGQEARLDVHGIVECVVRRHGAKVVLAHNHPGGTAGFSDMDLFSTDQLKKLLGSMQVQLMDHIVVGKNGDAISMRQYMGWTEG